MKAKILVLLALTIHSITFAQNNFQEKIINNRYYFTKYAMSVSSGDMDGDGDVDVLSASYYDDKIAWYENSDGEGTIISQNIISNDINGARTVIASDIDGDGDLDVVAAYDWNFPEEKKIVWYENIDGEGNFDLNNYITTDSHGAYSICATDIDGDGDIDILAASSGQYAAEYEICWYENLDGLGNFGDKNYISGILYRLVKSADFDGDGDMDVLAASFENIAWFENIDGEGNFGPMQSLSVYSYQDVNSVFPTDLDGDGDIDIMASMDDPGKIAWYENTDGAGTFSSQLNIINNVSGIFAIFSIDLDSDNDMDIIASNYYVGLVWYENISGVFEPYQTIASDFSYNIHMNDMDGDNDMDLFYVTAPDKIAWNENINENNIFGVQQIITRSDYNVRQISANYINSDNYIDIISITFDNKIGWYQNIDGGDNFSPINIISSDAEQATSVHSADIDSDGDIDVLSSSYSDNKIAWYQNLDDEGTFGLQQIITTNAAGANLVFAVDIDNDDDIDVLSASAGDNKIAWYENMDGAGMFGLENIITTNAVGASSVFAIDIDNDSDIDVLSASTGDNKIAWYENMDGAGMFSEEQVISIDAYNVKSVHASDIDNDGDIDVVSSYWGTGIIWYENIDGEGNFQYGQSIGNNEIDSTMSVYTKDLDGDNDMDIITSSSLVYGGSAIVWYENIDGNGSFISNQIIDFSGFSVLAYSFSEDIDDDGDFDVISQFDEKTVWYDNLIVSTEQYSLDRFYISPNPTSNTFKIHSKTEISRIELYNGYGQLVFVIKNSNNVDISDLSNGVYFIKIININNKKGIYKVIKK